MLKHDDLPYHEYGGATPLSVKITALLATLVAVGGKAFGYLPIGWLYCAVPFGILAALHVAFYTIRSATHEALRMDAEDRVLDDMFIEQAQEAGKRTLTPHYLAAQIAGEATEYPE